MKPFDEPSPPCNPSTAVTFAEVLGQRVTRRRAIEAGLGSLAVGFLGGVRASQSAESQNRGIDGLHELFTFSGVSISKDDEVRLPEGYEHQVIYPWGHPINNVSPAFKLDASNTAAEQEQQAGMGHDGMEWFTHPDHPNSSEHGLLCMNHEYAEQGLLYPDGAEPKMTDERIRKSQAAHGVSVIEVARRDGKWQVVQSPYARRITVNTPVRMSGPATALLGPEALGTVNNCACGKTPWGTYLTCEENFYGVFGSSDKKWEPNELEKRYGLSRAGFKAKAKDGQEISVYRWWEASDERFDLSKHRDEANRFGYVVEIDPSDPESRAVKRTALGRFRHENAAVTLAKDGRVVVYMGDDEKNEYIYKFVSAGKYQAQDRAANLKLLDEGTLYAARFDPDGSGEWLELKPSKELPDETHVCVYTRKAADVVKPTKMDRPEWIAVHPHSGMVYVTLTNNDQRGVSGKKPEDKDGPPADRVNPRTNNVFGHIASWREDGGDAAATRFRWDIFLLAGDPQTDVQTPAVNIKGDSFSCPDGLWFDPRGILWIQTDISSNKTWQAEYKYLGNNMMLAADPGRGVVRRFLTGPRGCEITGVTMTPDFKTMFVNIQHPGEPPGDLTDPLNPRAFSNWPDFSPTGRPRPATVVVFRKDGQPIGV